MLRELVGHEDVVLGHGGDACIVADNAGQGDLGQGLLLPRAEHVLVLPPKPAWEHPQTSCPRLCWTGRASPGLYSSMDARGPQQTSTLQHRGAPGPQTARGFQTSGAPLMAQSKAQLPGCPRPRGFQGTIVARQEAGPTLAHEACALEWAAPMGVERILGVIYNLSTQKGTPYSNFLKGTIQAK